MKYIECMSYSMDFLHMREFPNVYALLKLVYITNVIPHAEGRDAF